MKKQIFENEVYIVDETDVLNFVTKSSTKEQRKAFNILDVFINAAVCLKCKEYIRSKHRHDFKWCSCKSVAVDGGSHYAKRSGDSVNRIDVIESFY